MKRKSIWMAVAAVAVVVGLGAGTLLMVRVEPGFYRAAEQAADESRKQRSAEFSNAFVGLVNDVINGAVEIGTEDRSSWQWTFHADQINSYFSEDFVQKSGLAEKLLPKNLREPRVAIEPDRIRLGFRYGSGRWSTIVTVDLRVWLVAKEANVVALELQGMRAGALPFSALSFLEGVSEAIRQYHIDMSPWYRHRGNPVALLRLQTDPSAATARLTRLELRPGTLTIAGRSPYPSYTPVAATQQTTGVQQPNGPSSQQPQEH